jgi:hypothetical protein
LGFPREDLDREVKESGHKKKIKVRKKKKKQIGE